MGFQEESAGVIYDCECYAMCKKIFSYNTDISKNAYLNWRTRKDDIPNDMYVLAEGFAKAAELLIQQILENNRDKKADSIIFPILYSIDQSIELFLKAIIREIEILNGSQISNYTTHDIQSLLQRMLALIKKREAKTKGLQKHIAPVCSYIEELYALIKTTNADGKHIINIDFARYPIDTAGDPHFYVTANENVVIDIVNLQTRFQDIKSCLESFFYEYEYKINSEE